MKVEIDERFVEDAIKNYLISLGHNGRLKTFEDDLETFPLKALHINGSFFVSAVQLEDRIKDNENVYYDGILITPYRFWLMKSDNRSINCTLVSKEEDQDSVNSKTS